MTDIAITTAITFRRPRQLGEKRQPMARKRPYLIPLREAGRAGTRSVPGGAWPRDGFYSFPTACRMVSSTPSRLLNTSRFHTRNTLYPCPSKYAVRRLS